MKIINILFCLFLLVLNNCNSNDSNTLNNNKQQEKGIKKRDLDTQEPQEEEKKITITPEEEKKFNSLINAFKYTIEKLTEQIQGCTNENKSKCTNFFDWLYTDIQKQKELANAFTSVYDFLETKRQSKAEDEDFDTYIKGAIDCQVTNNEKCTDNKHGNGKNEIEQYFRGIAGDIFNKKSNDEIYQCLKDELLKTDNHYSGLTTNWQD
ncbi:Mlp lipoprotein family protein [Borreliella japonica]|uniref:Mlp lipoprotein family protein n=1 Tax=Borreliella japonica TaxID=34095 RepID=A0A1G4QP43_BORJA|nr:Mlp family lipoprotein [Borreliella japonica]SCW45819.1 Mlp lipoprotein family protein [Borreliella japonica]